MGNGEGKAMTKAELIKALEPYPDDMEVMVDFWNDAVTEVNEVREVQIETKEIPWVGGGYPIMHPALNPKTVIHLAQRTY
jgi:hypothetical protein